MFSGCRDETHHIMVDNLYLITKHHFTTTHTSQLYFERVVVLLSSLHKPYALAAADDIQSSSTQTSSQTSSTQPSHLQPSDYEHRQAVLRSYGLLDTEPEEVFDKITRLAAQVFDVPVALVSLMDFEQDRQWFKSCHGTDTRESDLNTSFCLHAVLSNETLVVPNALENVTFRDYSMVQEDPHMRFYAGAPLRTPEGVSLGALALIDFVPRDPLSPQQITMLETLASVVVDEILLRRSLEQQCRVEAELHEFKLKPAQAKLEHYQAELLTANAKLDIARSVQISLQPRPQDITGIADLDIATYARPAEDVGGDYLDVIVSGNKVRFGIGDVTGHGFESGLLMVMVQTALQALVDSGISDPDVIISILNKTLYHNLQRLDMDKSVTLSLLEYEQGNMTISGQHEHLLQVSPSGNVNAIDTFDLGFPLGLEADISQYSQQLRFALPAGAGVVLYTDGITEAENASGEFYGRARLEAAIRDAWQRSANRDAPAEAVKNHIINDVATFIGEQIVFDDITLIVIKRH